MTRESWPPHPPGLVFPGQQDTALGIIHRPQHCVLDSLEVLGEVSRSITSSPGTHWRRQRDGVGTVGRAGWDGPSRRPPAMALGERARTGWLGGGDGFGRPASSAWQTPLRRPGQGRPGAHSCEPGGPEPTVHVPCSHRWCSRFGRTVAAFYCGTSRTHVNTRGTPFPHRSPGDDRWCFLTRTDGRFPRHAREPTRMSHAEVWSGVTVPQGRTPIRPLRGRGRAGRKQLRVRLSAPLPAARVPRRLPRNRPHGPAGSWECGPRSHQLVL